MEKDDLSGHPTFVLRKQINHIAAIVKAIEKVLKYSDPGSGRKTNKTFLEIFHMASNR